MKMVFVVLILSTNILTAQKKIFGSVSDNIDVMGNVNIYNANSKRSNITNDSGEFEIFVKLKDTLEFSYLGYKKAKIIINKSHLGIVGLQVKLKKEAIALDVVYLKQNNLSGQLVTDVNRVKVKKGGNFSKELNLPFPNAKQATYEQRKMNTIGGGGGLIGRVYGLLSGEKKKMEKMLKAKQTEEYLIRLEKKYGFYVLDDLKIRKENVSRFLYFCYKSKGFKESKLKLIELMRFMKIKAKEFKKLNP